MLGTILIIFSLAVILYLLVVVRFGYVECDANVCLVGKTALVTGGSSGLGYQIVLALATRGCKVIIADKCVDVTIKNTLIEETNNQNITLEYVDFASFKSIRELADKLKKSEEKLDILFNNVGIGKAPEILSQDGLNLTFQINHFGPFLLTHLLVDLLKKGTDARIVFTSTFASFFHNMSLETVTNEEIQIPRYRMHDYSNSKFCTIVASDIFAEKLKKFNIMCNTYHPGVAKTTFFVNTKKNLNYFSFTDLFAYSLIHLLYMFVGVPAHKAARAGINLGVSKKFKNTTGIFFDKYRRNFRPRLADNKELCNKIWSASVKTVKLRPEEML